MSIILEVTDLHVRYGKVEALHGASLEGGRRPDRHRDRAERRGQVDHAGRHHGRAADLGAANGVVSYLGHNLAGLPVEKRVARGMCLVPEKRELFATMSVEDNLVLGAYRRKRAGERNYLDQMDVVYQLFPRLKERRRQEAGTLSGGERQMLAVGRALMAKPQLLMLDEPSLGLAPLIVKEIFHIISNLRSTGVATLLIEQNARAALQVADYGYVLETGDMTLEGPARELAVNPRVIETYLGLAKKAA